MTVSPASLPEIRAAAARCARGVASTEEGVAFMASLDSLLAALADAEAARDAAKDDGACTEAEEAHALLVEALDRAESAEAARVGAVADAARLREALVEFGHHGEDCEVHVGFYAPGIPAPCTCGLDAALSARVSPAGVILTPEQAEQVADRLLHALGCAWHLEPWRCTCGSQAALAVLRPGGAAPEEDT